MARKATVNCYFRRTISTMELSIIVCALELHVKKFDNARREETKHKCCFH
jgi:hypothetical protein